MTREQVLEVALGKAEYEIGRCILEAAALRRQVAALLVVAGAASALLEHHGSGDCLAYMVDRQAARECDGFHERLRAALDALEVLP